MGNLLKKFYIFLNCLLIKQKYFWDVCPQPNLTLLPRKIFSRTCRQSKNESNISTSKVAETVNTLISTFQ